MMFNISYDEEKKTALITKVGSAISIHMSEVTVEMSLGKVETTTPEDNWSSFESTDGFQIILTGKRVVA